MYHALKSPPILLSHSPRKPLTVLYQGLLNLRGLRGMCRSLAHVLCINERPDRRCLITVDFAKTGVQPALSHPTCGEVQESARVTTSGCVLIYENGQCSTFIANMSLLMLVAREKN